MIIYLFQHGSGADIEVEGVETDAIDVDGGPRAHMVTISYPSPSELLRGPLYDDELVEYMEGERESTWCFCSWRLLRTDCDTARAKISISSIDRVVALEGSLGCWGEGVDRGRTQRLFGLIGVCRGGVSGGDGCEVSKCRSRSFGEDGDDSTNPSRHGGVLWWCGMRCLASDMVGVVQLFIRTVGGDRLDDCWSWSSCWCLDARSAELFPGKQAGFAEIGMGIAEVTVKGC